MLFATRLEWLKSSSKTVWKSGMGPESGLRKGPGGDEGESIGCLLAAKTHAFEKPPAILQTVSPRTWVNSSLLYAPRSGRYPGRVGPVSRTGGKNMNERPYSSDPADLSSAPWSAI